MERKLVRLAAKRFVIIFAVSMVLVFVGNEVLYQMQKDEHDRLPQQVELVIPAGTAERVAQGESVPSLPEEMVFVEGDVLVVVNQDSESHQLGPLWVPSLSSASLNLDQPLQYGVQCSFQPSSYMGLDVRPRTTLGTRLQGLFLAAPATVIFLFLYSLLLYPLDKGKKTKSGQGEYVREKNAGGG